MPGPANLDQGSGGIGSGRRDGIGSQKIRDEESGLRKSEMKRYLTYRWHWDVIFANFRGNKKRTKKKLFCFYY
jgi:hypothetical protein